MNILPLLLSAVAVLLAAAALLKVLGSRGASESDATRSTEAAALRAQLEAFSTQIGALHSTLSEVPVALQAIRGDLAPLPATLATLPGQVARESGALDVLVELRAIRETGTVCAERSAAIRTELQTSGVARDGGFRRVTESVAALQASLESLRTPPDRADARASSLEPLLQTLCDQAEHEHAARAAVLERLDALVKVPDLLRALETSVVAQDPSARLETIASSLAGLPEAQRSLATVVSAQDPSSRLESIASSLAALPTSLGTLVSTVSALDSGARLDGMNASLSAILDLLRSLETSVPALDVGDRLDRQIAVLQDLRGDLLSLAGNQAAPEGDADAARIRDERLTKSLEDLALEMSGGWEALRDAVAALPARTAEEIAARPAPAPELEELAMAVRDAGALRGDSVRSVADAVARVAERLEESAENGRAAREDAASSLAASLSTLEGVASGVREALLPLGEALKGHGESVLPVLDGLGKAQERFEETAVSLRANQVEFASSVGLFSSAAQDLSTGLGAFAREGGEDETRDPAAVQRALLDALDRLLTGFAESLRATLAEADLRHREALAEIAARLPGTPA